MVIWLGLSGRGITDAPKGIKTPIRADRILVARVSRTLLPVIDRLQQSIPSAFVPYNSLAPNNKRPARETERIDLHATLLQVAAIFGRPSSERHLARQLPRFLRHSSYSSSPNFSISVFSVSAFTRLFLLLHGNDFLELGL